MDAEQPNQAEPIRRKRGRPPGSKKTRAFSLSSPSTTGSSATEPQKVPLEGQEVIFDEEQLAYSRAEEKLSPFSSLLRHILRHDRTEITRVAQEVGVTEITIYRWMNGSSDPRTVHLQRLLDVLPTHRGNLSYAIKQTFPGTLEQLEKGVREVSKEMYRRVLDIVTTTIEDDARHWQVTQTIFEGAMLQLDSNRHGLSISYAQVMPSHEDGIHSLREVSMRGQYPWPYDLESRVYIGSTTLAGSAVMMQRIQTWDNLSDEERLLVDIDEYEHSAAACPVMHAGRIAGVLVVSSTQVGFFTDKVACQSVMEYAQLMSLGIPDEEFVPPTLLHLRPMPSLRWQRAEITRSFLNRIVLHARKHGIGRQEAEHQVILEMEREFEERGRSLSENYLQDIYYRARTISPFESSHYE